MISPNPSTDHQLYRLVSIAHQIKTVGTAFCAMRDKKDPNIPLFLSAGCNTSGNSLKWEKNGSTDEETDAEHEAKECKKRREQIIAKCQVLDKHLVLHDANDVLKQRRLEIDAAYSDGSLMNCDLERWDVYVVDPYDTSSIKHFPFIAQDDDDQEDQWLLDMTKDKGDPESKTSDSANKPFVSTSAGLETYLELLIGLIDHVESKRQQAKPALKFEFACSI